MQTDIDALMRGSLGQWLADQTHMRAKAKEKAAWRWTWGAAVLMPVLALLWFGLDLPGDLPKAATIGGAAAVWWWGYRPLALAKKAIKVGINAAIAKSLGIAYSHDVEPGAEFDAVKTYGLVPTFARSSFEDRWHGMIEGHDFNLYEAHLQERRGSGKNHWVTVFRGVIIAMGFGRPFHSTTLLQRAGKHRKWLGLGGASDTVSFDGHRLDRVDQVHPAFADKFALYSDDRVEARMLVHPAYVEHLLKLEQAFAAKELRALFVRGTVVLAVETENLFESGSITPDADRMHVEKAARQFTALAGFALAINQTERGRVVRDPATPLGGVL